MTILNEKQFHQQYPDELYSFVIQAATRIAEMVPKDIPMHTCSAVWGGREKYTGLLIAADMSVALIYGTPVAVELNEVCIADNDQELKDWSDKKMKEHNLTVIADNFFPERNKSVS